MAEVLHAVPKGTNAYRCTNLETGDEAIVISTPIKVDGRVHLGWCELDANASPHGRMPACVNWRPIFTSSSARLPAEAQERPKKNLGHAKQPPT
jgi:hypothetical protein